MIEFAICVPLIAFLVVAVTECGRYTSQYQQLSQITVDGLNVIARTHDLEPNIICQTDGNPALPNPPLGCANATHHLSGHNNANIIASLQASNINMSDTNLRMESFYNPTLQTVRFVLYSEFLPLFNSVFNHVPFRIELTGPYLPGTGIGTGIGIPKQTLNDLAAGGYSVVDTNNPDLVSHTWTYHGFSMQDDAVPIPGG